MGGNRGKVILAIVLLVGAGVVTWNSVRSRGGLRPQLTLVCAATGKVYEIDRDKVVVVPSENPDTHEKTLFPIRRDDSGALYVNPHYRDAVKQLGEKNRYVDTETLAVRSPQ